MLAERRYREGNFLRFASVYVRNSALAEIRRLRDPLNRTHRVYERGDMPELSYSPDLSAGLEVSRLLDRVPHLDSLMKQRVVGTTVRELAARHGKTAEAYNYHLRKAERQMWVIGQYAADWIKCVICLVRQPPQSLKDGACKDREWCINACKEKR